MRIAESDGAKNYAGPSYEKATLQMKQADDLATRKHADKKSLISTSRQTVQTAEDAREIAMRNIETARMEAERSAAAGREATANASADRESQRRMNAEIATNALPALPTGSFSYLCWTAKAFAPACSNNSTLSW